VQPPLPEPEVVRGHLEEERDDRHDGDRCKGVPFPNAGPEDRRQQPGDSEHERHDAQSEPEQRKVLEERAAGAARNEVALRRNGVGPEHAREPAGDQQRDRDDD
jgi:hypothetical protein